MSSDAREIAVQEVAHQVIEPILIARGNPASR